MIGLLREQARVRVAAQLGADGGGALGIRLAAARSGCCANKFAFELLPNCASRLAFELLRNSTRSDGISSFARRTP
ncbi:MAG: hypothetical protein OXE83_07300 [Gammaproteobacteria bacterium]|nr:hypothetical protein [Gammaproteobacteria bacterium]